MKRKRPPAPRTRIGPELVRRTQRFAAQLESADSLAELARTITLRTHRLEVDSQPPRPREVQQLRGSLGVSQPVFARFVGVSVSALRDWEQGAKKPGGAATRLLREMLHDPAYWRKRLNEAMRPVAAGT